MLIFDSFPSRSAAEHFVAAVAQRQVGAQVFDNQDESDEVDPFPFELIPPIVLVERGRDEEGIEQLVDDFGASFAGT